MTFGKWAMCQVQFILTRKEEKEERGHVKKSFTLLQTGSPLDFNPCCKRRKKKRKLLKTTFPDRFSERKDIFIFIWNSSSIASTSFQQEKIPTWLDTVYRLIIFFCCNFSWWSGGLVGDAKEPKRIYFFLRHSFLPSWNALSTYIALLITFTRGEPKSFFSRRIFFQQEEKLQN